MVYICATDDGVEGGGVCLRVHYADCWSRPLRRTQREGVREKGERVRGREGEKEKTEEGEEAVTPTFHQERKERKIRVFPHLSK